MLSSVRPLDGIPDGLQFERNLGARLFLHVGNEVEIQTKGGCKLSRHLVPGVRQAARRISLQDALLPVFQDNTIAMPRIGEPGFQSVSNSMPFQ